MIKTIFLKWIAIGFLLFANSVYAQKRAALINDHVAVFYPEDFNVKANLPSFALVREVQEKDTLPDSWKVRVEFGEAIGKTMAFIKTDPETYLYGTGESLGDLVKNGTTKLFWNTDNPFNRDLNQRLYQSQPWVLAVRKDGTAFGVLADNTWKQELSLGNGILFSSEGPAFRVLVFEGKTPQDVLKSLAEVTGKMDLPPLWSLGYQQCRFSYYPDTRVKEIADTFRIKQIPCDVIWMDIHYMNEYRIFTFSPDRFPNPKETNDYLHQKGFKSIWMIDPGVKKEEGYFVYDSGTAKDVWVKDAAGNDFVGGVWPGDCVFPDFTMERTQKWWASLYKDYMANGVDGVWNDMNEPAVFGGPDLTMPVTNIHRGGEEHPKDVHLRYHNVYGMMMAKASREGILAANPNKRPFVLSRANYLGGQRYAAAWTGDNTASWEHLKMSIPMSLNLGLSGQPFSGPDIGGFIGNASPELFGQWIATGAFYPFCRAHTIDGSRGQEPWAFGEEIETVSRVALQRRYCLLPYLYTTFREASVNGMPVMRPVFFADFQNQDLRREDQAFLLGADLLVVPKWADDTKLPGGIWRTIDLVGENSEKSKYQPDLKQRGGTIIPVGKVIQSTAEYKTDSITLLVCLDDELQAKGVLYDDAGDGFDYRQGKYALYSFSASKTGDNAVTVTCEKTEGKLPEGNRFYRIGLVTERGIVYSDWDNKTTFEVNVSPL